MELRFDEVKHRYYYGDNELISCTKLMQKHGLAPDYSNVSPLVLEAKAKFGSLVHKEIEELIANGVIGLSTEVMNFSDYLYKHPNVKIIDNEFLVYNDIVAGRADLLIQENEDLIIADIKTTATVHKSSVSWQLSIYAALYKSLYNVSINKGRVYHFEKGGELKVIDLELKPEAEVLRLFDCERNNNLYQAPAILDDDKLTLLTEVEKTIKFYENKKKEAEAQAQTMRDALIKSMEQNGVSSFENDNIKITYVAPSVRTSIDSSRLKKEEPMIYEHYIKESKVKASLRITIK